MEVSSSMVQISREAGTLLRRIKTQTPEIVDSWRSETGFSDPFLDVHSQSIPTIGTYHYYNIPDKVKEIDFCVYVSWKAGRNMDSIHF